MTLLKLIPCILLAVASMAAEDKITAKPPTPEEQIALLKLERDALKMSNQKIYAALQGTQQVCAANTTAQQKEDEAFKKWQSAIEAAKTKSGCELDADYNCKAAH